MTQPAAWPGGAPLDPDRDEARRLLEDQLTSGDYRLQESVVRRVLRWLEGLLPDGLDGQLPPWTAWALLGVVILTAVSVIGYAASDRWRTARRLGVARPGAVLEGERRTADGYRRSAERALATGDAGTAVLEAYRAVAAGAIERTLLDDRAGLTAREIALALQPVFPQHGEPLRHCSSLFDEVRYGHHAPTPDQAREVLDLEATLRDTRPELGAAPALAGPWGGS